MDMVLIIEWHAQSRKTSCLMLLIICSIQVSNEANQVSKERVGFHQCHSEFVRNNMGVCSLLEYVTNELCSVS